MTVTRWRDTAQVRSGGETALSGLLKSQLASRRGDDAAAANFSRAALAAVDWNERQCVLQHIDWSIYIDESIGYLSAYVETLPDGAGRIVVCDATWETLSYEAGAFDHFLADMRAGGPGMKFIVKDVPPYSTAIRKEAVASGSDGTVVKDRITELQEKAHSLVVQAASLNRAPTDVQRQAFAVRYARMRTELAALRAELDGVDDCIALAGAALAEF